MLHVLFTPPAPSPGLATGTEASAPIRNPFLFHHRPNTLDRDRIVVPAGWDSWGKIGVLREGFEARVWGEAWDTDLADALETEDAGGAKRMYRALVPDQGAKVSSIHRAVIALSSIPPIAPAVAPIQCADGGTSVPCETLRRKLEETGSRSTWCVPQSHRDRDCWYRRAPWEQQLQPASRGEGACGYGNRFWEWQWVECECERRCCATSVKRGCSPYVWVGCGGCGGVGDWSGACVTDVECVTELDGGTDATRGIAKLFPEFVEFQGSSGGECGGIPCSCCGALVAKVEWQSWRDRRCELIVVRTWIIPPILFLWQPTSIDRLVPWS